MSIDKMLRCVGYSFQLLTGSHCPDFFPIKNRATPTNAARLTRQKEKGIPKIKCGLPFLCHKYPVKADM